MTESDIRKKMVAQMCEWYGATQGDKRHKYIVDTYNAHTPLARNYKVTYDDSWCATTVSASAILCGLTEVIPTECSCERQIELFKKIDSWEEDDSFVPSVADIIYYSWSDTGKGDCKNWANHVGVVVSVADNLIKVIEGNKGGKVAYRTIRTDARYIRGFATPKYSKLATEEDGNTYRLNVGEKIKTVKDYKAYNSSDEALKGGATNLVYKKGEYYIYKTYNGATNISRKKGVPGAWVVL